MTDADKRLHTVPTSVDLLVHTLSLPELLAGARARQRSHIGELHRRFGPELLRRVHQKDTTVTADEILTDVFMRLPDVLVGYTDSGAFEGWLWTIARNLLIDKQRKRQRLPEQLGEHDQLPSSGSDGLQFARRDTIETLALVLTPQQREAWLMSMDGFSNAEIAERLAITTNNVYQVLHQARKRVAKEAIDRGLTPSDFFDPEP